eukprot:Hpha_TRINITY_DN16576_c0_g5::TRINITY_DN16576_c0_g5_i1::g.133253::m.133253
MRGVLIVPPFPDGHGGRTRRRPNSPSARISPNSEIPNPLVPAGIGPSAGMETDQECEQKSLEEIAPEQDQNKLSLAMTAGVFGFILAAILQAVQWACREVDSTVCPVVVGSASSFLSGVFGFVLIRLGFRCAGKAISDLQYADARSSAANTVSPSVFQEVASLRLACGDFSPELPIEDCLQYSPRACRKTVPRRSMGSSISTAFTAGSIFPSVDYLSPAHARSVPSVPSFRNMPDMSPPNQALPVPPSGPRKLGLPRNNTNTSNSTNKFSKGLRELHSFLFRPQHQQQQEQQLQLSSESTEEANTIVTGSNGVEFIVEATRLGAGSFGTVHRCLDEDGGLRAAKRLPLPPAILNIRPQSITIIRPEELCPFKAEDLGFTCERLVVADVTPSSPADAAGLECGMLVIKVGNVTVLDLKTEQEGEKGSVDEALEQVADRSIVMSVLPKQSATKWRTGIRSVRSVVQELTVLSRLRSKHIIELETFARTDNAIFIIMELAPWGSLENLILTYECLPSSAVSRYTKGMLLGLAYLHSKQVQHRDFKTGNVLLGVDGRCKLTDFGTARFMSDNESEQSEQVVGTPAYLAPEACLGRATFASDVWGLGIVVMELLGMEPYEGDYTPWGMLRAISTGLRPLLDMNEGKEKNFLQRCLQDEGEKRPSAQALLEDPFISIPGKLSNVAILAPAYPHRGSVASTVYGGHQRVSLPTERLGLLPERRVT